MDSVKTDGDWSLQYTPPPSEWFYSHNASAILCPSAKGGERTILDMRGWGYLTGKGHGALGLDSETAAREQDALALFIIDACKAAASPAGDEVRVKPLVWEQGAAHQIKAGHYLIEDQGSNWTGGDRYWLFFGGLNATNRIGRYGEQGDAIAAADENNRLAILSALEPTPSTDAVRRQAREEALEEAVRYLASGFRIGELRDDVRAIVEEIRARALSTPPAGAAALNEGEE